jgi:alkylation response protein AidB-like acyl-CoA dehydrogenase
MFPSSWRNAVMDFGFSREEEKLIEEVRDFIRQEATPELLVETLGLGLIYGGKEGRKFIQKFAAQGWLTPNWPKEYGGWPTRWSPASSGRDVHALVPTFRGRHAGPTLCGWNRR